MGLLLRCLMATRRLSGRVAAPCPAGRSNAFPWLVPCSRMRRLFCLMKRPRVLIPRMNGRSRPLYATCRTIRRLSLLRTGLARFNTPIRLLSLSKVKWFSRERINNCSLSRACIGSFVKNEVERSIGHLQQKTGENTAENDGVLSADRRNMDVGFILI